MLCGAQRHRTRLLHNHQLAAPRYARPGEAGQVCGWAAGRVRPVCPIGLVAGEATGRQAGPQGQLQPIGSSPMVSRTPVRRPPGEARRLAGPGTRVGAPSLATVTSLPPPCLRHTNPDPRTVSWPTPCDASSTGVRGAVHAQSKASSASSSQQATRRTEARLLTNTLLNVCTGPSMACRRARAGARHVASCEELSPREARAVGRHGVVADRADRAQRGAGGGGGEAGRGAGVRAVATPVAGGALGHLRGGRPAVRPGRAAHQALRQTRQVHTGGAVGEGAFPQGGGR